MKAGRASRALFALVPAAAAAALVGIALSARAQSVELVVNEQLAANKAATASQERINQLNDETSDALAKYRQNLTEADSFRRYNQQLEQQVASQTEEMGKIKAELDEIEVTSREVLPLMQKMVDTLDRFVSLDVPFLLDERTKRVAGLKAIMPRADVSISEKYRRILEAYQIEMEYGRTLDAYDGKLEEGSSAGKTVEFVRLGRVSLMYRTLDGNEVGYWDATKKSWVKDNGYAKAVREALRVAKKRGAPDLMYFAVPAAQKVEK